MRYPQPSRVLRTVSLAIVFHILSLSGHGQTLSWIVDHLVWLEPPVAPISALSGRPTAVCFLTPSWSPSGRILDSLKRYAERSGDTGARVVVVLHQVGPRLTDSLIAACRPLLRLARDSDLDVFLFNQRSKAVPFIMLVDPSGKMVWEGGITDTTVSHVLDRFVTSGETPSDPSRPLTSNGTGAIEIVVQRSSPSSELYTTGVTRDGTRLWVRGMTATSTAQAVALFLDPLADVFAYEWSTTTPRYDVDVTIRNVADRHRLKDSILAVVDSALGTITVVDTFNYARKELLVGDRDKLATYRSDLGLTVEEIARRYHDRFQSRTIINPSLISTDRFEVPVPFTDQRVVDTALNSMGLGWSNNYLAGPVVNIVIRDSVIPESDVIYQLNRSHVMPTIGATLQVGDTATWYGGEIGVTYGKLSNGHGFYGIHAWRSCVEILTDGTDVIGGVNIGIDLSSIFVMRLRTGVYSDFSKNTTVMFLPEFGFSTWGRYALTIGANLPILGRNVLPPSFRLALTANILPKGAH